MAGVKNYGIKEREKERYLPFIKVSKRRLILRPLHSAKPDGSISRIREDRGLIQSTRVIKRIICYTNRAKNLNRIDEGKCMVQL
jgi:hypothetical protein